MDKEKFWELIDEAKEKEDANSWLVSILVELSLSELVDFNIHAHAYLNEFMNSESETMLKWFLVSIYNTEIHHSLYWGFASWIIREGQHFFREVMEHGDDEDFLKVNLPKGSLPQQKTFYELVIQSYARKRERCVEEGFKDNDRLLLLMAEDYQQAFDFINA